METFSSLLAICEGNPLVTGGSPSQSQWRETLMFSLGVMPYNWHKDLSPVLEPMLTHYQLTFSEQTSVKFESRYQNLQARKCTLKCRMKNCRPYNTDHKVLTSTVFGPRIPSNKIHHDQLRQFFAHCLTCSMNCLLNKQSNCLWFETPWRSCDVTARHSIGDRDLISNTAHTELSNIEHLTYLAQGNEIVWMITRVNITRDGRPVSVAVHVSILSCDSAMRGRSATNTRQERLQGWMCLEMIWCSIDVFVKKLGATYHLCLTHWFTVFCLLNSKLDVFHQVRSRHLYCTGHTYYMHLKIRGL